jgi:hypothetical protein
MNAFERGWTAAEFDGKTMRNNPYKRGTAEWMLWRNGFRAFYESIGLPAPV